MEDKTKYFFLGAAASAIVAGAAYALCYFKPYYSRNNNIKTVLDEEPTLLEKLLKKHPTWETTKAVNDTLRYPKKIKTLNDITIDHDNIRYEFLFYRLRNPDELTFRIKQFIDGHVLSRVAVFNIQEKDIPTIWGKLHKTTDIQDIFLFIANKIDQNVILPKTPSKVVNLIDESQAVDDAIVIAARPQLYYEYVPVVQHPQLNELYHAIGWLEYGDDQGKRFICTAFLVDEDVIMTARHALNALLPNQITFHLNIRNEIVTFCLTEVLESYHTLTVSAASERNQHIFPDYALLKITKPNDIGLPPPLILDSKPSEIQNADLYRIAGYNAENVFSELTIQTQSADELTPALNYYANTQPGFSGAPLIDRQTGKVVGLHCKTTTQPIAKDERTALSIHFLYTEYPNSKLSNIINQSAMTAEIPHLIGNPNYQEQFMASILPDISSLIEDFNEREESGGLRDSGLGPTPKLGKSSTYRCILARWALKGEEKLKFKKIDGFNVSYNNVNKTYTLTSTHHLRKVLVLDSNDLLLQAEGTPIKFIINDKINDKITAELLNRFFSPEYWKVKIIKSKDTTNKTREWVDLTEKIPNNNQAAINMGHKLSANEYWLKGSEDYQKKRLAEKKIKLIHNNSKYEAKEQEYELRYTQYSMPGYLSYGMPINEEFMRNPKNYRFEWHARNKSDGAKNKAGNFKQKCPPGLEVKKRGDSQYFGPK